MAPEFGIFDRPRSAPKKFNTDSAIKIHLTEAEKEKAMKVLIAAKPRLHLSLTHGALPQEHSAIGTSR